MRKSPIILAIETSTSNCSIAIEHQQQLFVRNEAGNNIHSSVILDCVSEVLSEASLKVSDLDAVAVGKGPGSFTGLRVGIGVGQGIAYGAGGLMVAVSSLQALAYQSPKDGIVLAGIDARMNEVYWGVFDKQGGIVNQLEEPKVSPPEEVLVPKLVLQEAKENNKNIYLVGNAWQVYKDSLLTDLIMASSPILDVLFPEAASVLHIAHTQIEPDDWVVPSAFMPEYVRNNVAVKSVK